MRTISMSFLVTSLCLSLDEVHSRRAVELRNDHPLRSVYDELPATDHDRHVPQIDQVLLDFVAVLANEAQANPKRHAISEAQLAAFILRIAGLTQLIPYIMQRQVAVVALDREHLAQQSLEPVPLATGRGPYLKRVRGTNRRPAEPLGDRLSRKTGRSRSAADVNLCGSHEPNRQTSQRCDLAGSKPALNSLGCPT
jgi:hypothetical protein